MGLDAVRGSRFEVVGRIGDVEITAPARVPVEQRFDWAPVTERFGWTYRPPWQAEAYEHYVDHVTSLVHAAMRAQVEATEKVLRAVLVEMDFDDAVAWLRCDPDVLWNLLYPNIVRGDG